MSPMLCLSRLYQARKCVSTHQNSRRARGCAGRGARVLHAALVMLFAFLSIPLVVTAQDGSDAVVVEDFEDAPVDSVPARWGYATDVGDDHLIDMSEVMSEDDRFYIVEEDENRFLRGYTRSNFQRISFVTADAEQGIEWNTEEHPVLEWRWRAHELPDGAREDESDLNDTGGAVYVTFETNWLGWPRSIKYTYSSTLPVGTVVSYRNLKVLVVASGRDGEHELGEWHIIRRNVVEDYKNIFGRTAPDTPLAITLWTDSTETETSSKVDFDMILLRSALADATR